MIYYIPFIQSGCVFNATFNYAKVVWLNVVKVVYHFNCAVDISFFLRFFLLFSR